ncbi:hypothetical protein Zmor_004042 [Zophobas morio]|uniref:HTH psq-type domain-containing protein n=1 Tax=Zophobas morio TaxID=2755281 RepID=A0AA38M1Z2_9CUCU|nr:hypothetical protein Zmor_004042 [Zophobas morio]
MVRNFKRKTQRALKYSKDDIATAVSEIKRGVLPIYRAHKLYKIPKTTLFYHVTGRRGLENKTQGRSWAIQLKIRNDLLKVFKQWSSGDLVFPEQKSYI